MIWHEWKLDIVSYGPVIEANAVFEPNLLTAQLYFLALLELRA